MQTDVKACRRLARLNDVYSGSLVCRCLHGTPCINPSIFFYSSGPSKGSFLSGIADSNDNSLTNAKQDPDADLDAERDTDCHGRKPLYDQATREAIIEATFAQQARKHEPLKLPAHGSGARCQQEHGESVMAAAQYQAASEPHL